jgi:hypothetical protein
MSLKGTPQQTLRMTRPLRTISKPKTTSSTRKEGPMPKIKNRFIHAYQNYLNLSHCRIHAENYVFFVVLQLEVIENSDAVIAHSHP